jgi:thiaminase/transcriptional activator TenA
VAFADELKQCSIEVWQKILTHIFIKELATNTLPVNKFLFYLKQDHYFLEEFSKFLQSAKQKAINNKMNQWLDGLYMSTVHFEMEMQRQMLRSIDLSLSSPALSSSSSSPSSARTYPHFNNKDHHLINAKHTNIIPSKTTLKYTSYLKHVSSSDSFSEIVSVMAPCPWTYLEIAQKLSKTSIQNEVYSNWVKFYSSNESHKQVYEIKQILNMLGQAENERSKDIMKHYFANACKFEYLFWEMAYNLHG